MFPKRWRHRSIKVNLGRGTQVLSSVIMTVKSTHLTVGGSKVTKINKKYTIKALLSPFCTTDVNVHMHWLEMRYSWRNFYKTNALWPSVSVWFPNTHMKALIISVSTSLSLSHTHARTHTFTHARTRTRPHLKQHEWVTWHLQYWQYSLPFVRITVWLKKLANKCFMGSLL